jgi:hypothetical protein
VSQGRGALGCAWIDPPKGATVKVTMGDPSRGTGQSRWAWAAIPFAVALGVSSSTLNGSLAPLKGAGQMHLEQAPPPPAPAPAHHVEPLYESSEPVNV